MKKKLIKVLVYFLRKLQKPVHREYKMSKKELNRILVQNHVQNLEELRRKCEYIVGEAPNPKPVEIGEVFPEIYVYHNSNFSVNMKNIPSRFIQDYYLAGNDELQLEVLLGGEIEMNEVKDVYDELKAKSYSAAVNDKEGETIEIEIFSTQGYSRRITLTNARVVGVDAFSYGNQIEGGLHKASVTIKYETKKVEKF